MPDYIQILPAIPKTASEKPQERYLAQAFTSRPDTTYAINDYVINNYVINNYIVND